MGATLWKKIGTPVAVIFAIAILLSASPAPPKPQSAQPPEHELVLALDPNQCKVHYTVDSTLHTVHGTFNVKSGSVQFNPQTGKSAGEIRVYATSGDSGNSSRDERMHKEILETLKYPEAVFRPVQIEGKVAPSGASDVKIHGVMQLHGGEHEMVATVHAVLDSDHWKGTAQFDVPYIQWGIKDPSNWFLKVKPVVNISVDMAGTVKSPN
jgi:polyisoprenoid-binding protein YceI